jgi:hypothetical protein
MERDEAFTTTEPSLAFVPEPQERPGLEIRVNFGLFAGREATAAEIDALAKALLPDVGEVTIVAEQRHELSEDVEAAIHQVRVEVEDANLPAGDDALGALTDRLLDSCDDWARRAIDARHVDF